MKRHLPLLLALVLASGGAAAGEPWLAPGNMQARHDLQMLVDDGILDLPVSGWPIAVSDVANALSRVPATRPSPRPSPATVGEGGRIPAEGVQLTPAQSAAVARLRKLASEGRPELGVEVRAAARPMQLRTFADEPREEGELTGWASGFFGTRWGGRLELTVVADADDDDTFRYDGSYFAGKFGNWIVTAGAQDRWWGSGWEGSLILSNSARPVPAISLDRAVSIPSRASGCAGSGRGASRPSWATWRATARITPPIAVRHADFGASARRASRSAWNARRSGAARDARATGTISGTSGGATTTQGENVAPRTNPATSSPAGTSAGPRRSATGTTRSTTSTRARPSTTRFRGPTAVSTSSGWRPGA
jgi:hypothetical protein